MSAPRKSRAGDAFGRLGTAPMPTTATEVPSHRDTTPPQRAEPVRKFTIRLYSESEAHALDEWLLQARREVGHRVEQSRLVREMLRMVTTDPELSARVRQRLQDPEG